MRWSVYDAMCRRIPSTSLHTDMPHEVAEQSCNVQESIKQKELAKHRTAAVLKREQDRAAKGNTLDKITEKFKEGPLLLLRRYYKTSVRLQIVTRHASGVRGTATGKHFLLTHHSTHQSLQLRNHPI